MPNTYTYSYPRQSGCVPKGAKTVNVENRKINSSLPEGEMAELVRLIERTKKWNDVADFVRQAVREKLERWKRENPYGPPAKE